MSAVGIVTLGGYTNFGNRLQNYALQEVLKSLGVERVEAIDGLPRAESRLVRAKRLALTPPQELFERVRQRGAGIRPDTYSSPPERQAAIRAFSEEFIQVAPAGFQDMSTEELALYSHFVVGSDQVWNPAYTHANPEWFLSFAPEGRRIAYAASFGVPSIPKYAAGRYRNGLRGLTTVSVREERASELVRELAGLDAQVVLDPTMVLEPSRWHELARRPHRLSGGGYVAKFMLAAGDGTPASGADLSGVEGFARRKDLEIVDLHDPIDPELLAMGPLEFIGAIQGSELVVTDSFHTAVFAVLFHRPFLLVGRGGMNSRFETLLSHTGLTDRFLAQADNLDGATEIDWSAVDDRLATARSKSLGFLRTSLQL
ncbi:polysaccharide pyruvyl transferase family protein [Tessaracoccus flavus]|uniref:Polysaccharide pyruvyl transferase domain-containing protein n=1 Tax=Tessaracoccus flavus TaxID=1610493 RepID=A0A1Q2CI11_9ACTN|nr:polysaccharide pyruvyl transferase family protein [Tessaracoccus flavus]AQP45752.1 hypothetical protein RPIT_13830 [Tessaracoccus flavus]SDZ12218.1 Polysaccharide pyruvyl transferase [Tessaracoccus flavus]